MVSNYADKLQKVEGRLYLTGISEGAREQVVRTGKFSPTGPVQAYDATSSSGNQRARQLPTHARGSSARVKTRRVTTRRDQRGQRDAP